MVCYMKKGGVAVADGGTLLLALPFSLTTKPFVIKSFEPLVIKSFESRFH